jgi:hypothetical protein
MAHQGDYPCPVCRQGTCTCYRLGSAAQQQRDARVFQVEALCCGRCPGLTFVSMNALADHTEKVHPLALMPRCSGENGAVPHA